ncbi:MAG: GtrA family protein [Lachnospiraceae bacterium]|nr:GtrA family protein [Lachnospiraceae bacterium]
MTPSELLDSIFHWVFRKFPKTQRIEPYYKKYKELMLYGIFGLGTFLISMGSYWLFTENFGWYILISNAMSWVFATAFAFFTNRKYVFVNHPHGGFAFFYQLGTFSTGRLFTLGIEEFMLLFFIGLLQQPNMPVKFFSQVIVIVLNYIFSKLLVFGRNPLGRVEDDFS